MAGLQKSKLYEKYINLYQIIKRAYVVVRTAMTSVRRSKPCVLPMLMLKTILDEDFAIQNNHGQGKCYQPQPLASADNTSETLIFPDITKTQSNNYYTLL